MSDIILTIAGILVVVIVALIFKSFVAIIIGLPLFEILLIVSRLTAETYVVDKINEKKLEQK